MNGRPALACFVAISFGGALNFASERWAAVTWHHERALQSTSSGWTAIVSINRGRLVHFGPTASGENLLFAPAAADDSFGWGGHRVWLGPQSAWSAPWPPPPAWERGAVDDFSLLADGTLVLHSPAAGDGWPTFRRYYRWHGARLTCGVEVQSDGARPAQVVQILQVPTSVEVRAQVRSDASTRIDFAGLPAGRRRQIERQPDLAGAGQVAEGAVVLRHWATVDKYGFRPQSLQGRIGRFMLIVARGESTGEAVGEPDEGFLTQVYLGGHEPFVELEQLSPLWRAGTEARFEMAIEAIDATVH